MAGALDARMLDMTEPHGETLRAALRRVGGNPDCFTSARRDDIAAFLELHIEQGIVLESQSLDVGIVTSIAGIRRIEITFEGAADHAGTTPMALRRDALVAAANTVVTVRRVAERLAVEGPDYFVATVGILTVEPGGANVVPGKCRLVIDARTTNPALTQKFVDEIERESKLHAEAARASRAPLVTLSDGPPAACDPMLRAECCARAPMHLVFALPISPVARVTILRSCRRICPSAMVFVPCRNGKSHAPEEWADRDQIAAGAAVMLQTVKSLDRSLPRRGSGERRSALMGRILGLQDVEAAIRGGSVFAAGGGGWADHGRMLGTAAVTIGHPELVSMDEVPDDAFIATAAAIGAPAGTTEWQMLGVDYVKAVEMLQDALGAPIYGLMIGQNGMSSTMNAWLPSALLGTKVVDAVGDIRAHPTGDMGSIGMASSPEATIQVAVGGHRASHSYIELVVRGATAKISPILRKAADMSGGFIASCRNPVRAAYVKQHAALGGISRALELGHAIMAAEAKGGRAVIEAICRTTSGKILGEGKVHAQGRDLYRRRVRHRHHHHSLRDARSRAPCHERIHGGRGRRLTSGDISRCDHDVGNRRATGQCRAYQGRR